MTVTNVGPGHALPTGEPMRSVVLTVDATCGATPLVPTGGDVVPDIGGYVAVQDATGDWARWPEAAVGDVVRVVAVTGTWVDYEGYGPFGDGTFTAAEKGLAAEAYVGEAAVTAVDDEVVTLSTPLPAGDRAYLARGDALAGEPGFAFARVLVGADGERMVPHFDAVDVASDNRLLPQASWTSTHTFAAATCAAPTVRATLLHRNYPWRLAAERGWALVDLVMAEATR